MRDQTKWQGIEQNLRASRPACRLAELAAELVDGVAHGLLVGATPAAPHPAPEGVTGRRPAGVGREGVREPVRAGGAPHRAAGDGHPARRAVDGRSLCSRGELAYDCITHTGMPAGNPGRSGRDRFRNASPAMPRTDWDAMT